MGERLHGFILTQNTALKHAFEDNLQTCEPCKRSYLRTQTFTTTVTTDCLPTWSTMSDEPDASASRMENGNIPPDIPRPTTTDRLLDSVFGRESTSTTLAVEENTSTGAARSVTTHDPIKAVSATPPDNPPPPVVTHVEITTPVKKKTNWEDFL